jgi:hemerythrin-like domain-containing protein
VYVEAIEVLRAEHRCISRMLDCFERVTELAHATGRLEGAASAELLALFVHFADGLHQRREESYLFPRLLARARSVEERIAIGRLCGDHERERQCLRQLNEGLLAAIYGHASDLAEFLREAKAFVRLHRSHLLEESQRLLPLAERVLQPEDDARLLAAFHDLDQKGPDPGLLVRRIQALGEALGLQASALS